MSLRPRKGTGRKTTEQREQANYDKAQWQKIFDKRKWENIGHDEYGKLFDRIQTIDENRVQLTESQNNRFLQIEDDFHNEQATPAFVDQDLAALEKELGGATRPKKTKFVMRYSVENKYHNDPFLVNAYSVEEAVRKAYGAFYARMGMAKLGTLKEKGKPITFAKFEEATVSVEEVH